MIEYAVLAPYNTLPVLGVRVWHVSYRFNSSIFVIITISRATPTRAGAPHRASASLPTRFNEDCAVGRPPEPLVDVGLSLNPWTMATSRLSTVGRSCPQAKRDIRNWRTRKNVGRFRCICLDRRWPGYCHCMSLGKNDRLGGLDCQSPTRICVLSSAKRHGQVECDDLVPDEVVPGATCVRSIKEMGWPFTMCPESRAAGKKRGGNRLKERGPDNTK